LPFLRMRVIFLVRLWLLPISMLIVTPFVRAQTPPPTNSLSVTPSEAPSPLQTFAPSVRSTSKPSNNPTTVNDAELRSFTGKDITIILTGVLPLDPEETLYFQNRTEEYIEFYFNNGADERMSLNGFKGVYDVTVTIRIVSMNPPFTDTRKLSNKCLRKATAGVHDGMETCTLFLNRRRLQTEELRIKYDQTMTYRFDGELNEEADAEDLIQDPFSILTKRLDYISYLKGTQSSVSAARAFENLTKVGLPELFVDKKEISMLTIIASAVGGAVFIVLVVVLFLWKEGKERE
jgi:hypothetical protein